MTETADRMRAYVRKNAKFGPLTDSDVEQVAELLAEYAASEREAGRREAAQCVIDEMNTSCEAGNTIGRRDSCDNILTAIRALLSEPPQGGSKRDAGVIPAKEKK